MPKGIPRKKCARCSKPIDSDVVYLDIKLVFPQGTIGESRNTLYVAIYHKACVPNKNEIANRLNFAPLFKG